MAQDWIEKSAAGISLRSVTYVEVLHCDIENVSGGLFFGNHSDHGKALYNTITRYSMDGSRIISDDILFAYNTIRGCMKVDDNHDDAIQSYSQTSDYQVGTTVIKDVIVRGNLIIGIDDPEHPLAGSPQGIGCFDGFFENWIVENNVVIVNHYHGISFYGMKNSKILNNTVIDQVPGDDISPWIMVTDHKDDRPSENCIVANNIAFRTVSASGNNVTEHHNYIFGHSNYDSIYYTFVDPDNLNFDLVSNEFTQRHLINLGEYFPGTVSSEKDIQEKKRNDAPDLGAFEYTK